MQFIIKFLGYILAGIRAIVLILMIILFLLCYMGSRLVFKHTTKSAFKLRRALAKVTLWLLNVQIEKFGNHPTTNSALMVSNHRSFIDPVILSLYIDVFIIAKAEVANMPLINKGVELTGVIYVKREDESSRKATRKTLIKTLDEGKNVLIFAEGTVCKSKEILPLRYGSFIAAAAHNVRVYPMAIEYQSSKDLWFTKSFLGQFFNQFGKWKTYARVKFGDVIQSNDGEVLHDLTEDWIRKEVSELQEDWSKAFD